MSIINDIWNLKICVVDYETKNLNLSYRFNQIWEGGYILAKGKDIVEQDHHYVWWGDKEIPISEGAKIMTKYDKELVKKEGISPEEAYDRMTKHFSSSDIILSQNGIGYDFYMAKALAEAIGRQVPSNEIYGRNIDILCLAKAASREEIYDGSIPLIAWQLQKYHNRYKGSFKLGSLASTYGVEIDENRQHEALYDCEKTFEIFKKLIYQVKI